MNKDTLSKISYGLYVISSFCNEKDTACIVNSFFQLTDDPLQVCVVLNKKNYTTELIKDSQIFNCGVLIQSTSMDIIKHFGYQSGRNVDKFKDIPYFEDIQHIKQIKENIAATFSCKVTKELDVGTHIMFIANVIDCSILCDDSVLTYNDYHMRKSKKGYRCTICGFIYDGELLPVDYICPICKVDARYFEKIE